MLQPNFDKIRKPYSEIVDQELLFFGELENFGGNNSKVYMKKIQV